MNLKSLLKGEISQQDLLNYYNATITYEDLPLGIDGCVWLYENIYNIFINASLSYYDKRETILHELAHVELCHLSQKDNDLLEFKRQQYEDEADRYIIELKKEIE